MSMAIHYTCRCGANIRLPGNVVGRKARCNSCGHIFTVPAPEAVEDKSSSIPLEPELPVRPRAKTVEPAQPANAWPVSTELADRDDILAPPVDAPRYLPPPVTAGALAEDDDELGPGKSYWADLAGTFLFILEGANSVTFLFITLVQMLAMGSGFLMGRVHVFLFLALALLWGYLCTFYMAVIRETAGGEDELPNCSPESRFELAGNIFQFAGTWLLVFVPAVAFAAITYFNFGQVDWTVVKIIGLVGIFFWPALILGVATCGGFHGLWPHLVVRTVTAAPLAYLGLWGVLFVAGWLQALPYSDSFQSLLAKLSKNAGGGPIMGSIIINAILTTYASIVAMRAIGLYYRHYKRRFPWTAE